ncbi:MAG: hypothetical protein V1740_05770 [Candidatus Woesearchaeota archaeon]
MVKYLFTPDHAEIFRPCFRTPGNIRIGIWGPGDIGSALAIELLKPKHISGLQLEQLFLYDNQDHKLLIDAMRHESPKEITSKDLDKIVLATREDAYESLSSLDLLFVTGQDPRVRELLDNRVRLTRRQMTDYNRSVIDSLGQQMNVNKDFGGIVCIVTNQPETLCEYANWVLPVPERKIIGMTHIDTSRLRNPNSTRFPFAKGNERAFAIGMHGNNVIFIASGHENNRDFTSYQRILDEIGDEIHRVSKKTIISTAEAAYETACAVFDPDRIVVAATPYTIGEKQVSGVVIPRSKFRIYLSVPVTFDANGAHPHEMSLEYTTDQQDELARERVNALLEDRYEIGRGLIPSQGGYPDDLRRVYKRKVLAEERRKFKRSITAQFMKSFCSYPGRENIWDETINYAWRDPFIGFFKRIGYVIPFVIPANIGKRLLWDNKIVRYLGLSAGAAAGGAYAYQNYLEDVLKKLF